MQMQLRCTSVEFEISWFYFKNELQEEGGGVREFCQETGKQCK